MAAGDYRACDVCGAKTFYDANLSYTWEHERDAHTGPLVEENGEVDPYGYALGSLGSWAIVCASCSTEWTARVVRRGTPKDPNR